MASLDFDAAWSGETPQALPSDQEREEAEKRKDDLRARVFSLADVLAQDSDVAEPLLGPLIRRGQRTILGGYGGHGKSTMAFQMMVAACGHGDFLGYRGTGTRGLFIDLEQSITDAQRQVIKAFWPSRWDSTATVADMVDSVDGLPAGMRYASWPEGVELSKPGPDLEVVEEIISDQRPDVVMLDPIYKIFMGSNQNDLEIITAFLKQLDRLRVEYGFAVLLPMHPRKAGPVGHSLTMHDLYGAGVWSWWAEVILMLGRKPDNKAFLKFEKDRSGDLDVETWRLRFIDSTFERIIEDADGPGAPAIDQILKLIARDRPDWLTRKDFEEMLGLERDTVNKACRELERKVDDGTIAFVDVHKHGQRGLHKYRARPLDAPIRMLMDEFAAEEEF